MILAEKKADEEVGASSLENRNFLISSAKIFHKFINIHLPPSKGVPFGFRFF